MTKLISHRGNLNGPMPGRENSLEAVDRAVAAGFDVEVDLRFVGHNFYLGHDFPVHLAGDDWLDNRCERLLFHVKDFRALLRVKECFAHWHWFCHAGDPFTVTSVGYVWLHDLHLPANYNCIVPLISKDLLRSYGSRDMHAICTDFCV